MPFSCYKLNLIKTQVISFLLKQTGSASGAICKRLRKWTKTFSAEELEFYALHYPAEPWKKLADICHFKPKRVSLPLVLAEMIIF